MNIVHQPRAWGKTTRLVDHVIKHGGVIATYSIQERDRIRKAYVAKGLLPGQVEWFMDLLLRGPCASKVHIDNADLILAQCIGRNSIETITITKNPSKGHFRALK